jgi:hypothetical protein
MGRPESKIENYLRRRVAETGGNIRKARWIGRRGGPDDYVWWPGGLYAWVECKAEGEEVDWRSIQGREIRRMHDDGLEVYVVSTKEQVDDMITRVRGG